jgi:hypothetical protein
MLKGAREWAAHAERNPAYKRKIAFVALVVVALVFGLAICLVQVANMVAAPANDSKAVGVHKNNEAERRASNATDSSDSSQLAGAATFGIVVLSAAAAVLVYLGAFMAYDEKNKKRQQR